MSAEAGLLATSARLRWRRLKGVVFAGCAAASVAAGIGVVGTLLVSTVRQSFGIVPMHATAKAGLSLSLRSVRLDAEDGAHDAPYVAIAQVAPASDAERSGMHQGDALVSVGGEPVTDVRAVWDAVARQTDAAADTEVTWVPSPERLLGDVIARPVAGEIGKFAVLLDWVAPDSAAARAGLRSGDALVSVGGMRVTGSRQAWQAIVVAARDADGPVPVRVERGGRDLEVLLDARIEGHVRLDSSVLDALAGFVTRLDEPRYPEHAGLAAAIIGSFYIVLVTALIAFPLGAAAAVYLEEYAPRNRWTAMLEILIANLAGVPSVVYGIIGLEVLARAAGLGRSIIAGGITLTLLALPIMIIASREALRTVPPWIREAAHSVGATKWQVVRYQVIPYALPGMLTGMILSMSRVIGEAAPLILLGAFLYVTYLPQSLMDTFTVVPLQIFSWATRPQAGYEIIAAAAIVVLVTMLVALNAVAIYLRQRYQPRWT